MPEEFSEYQKIAAQFSAARARAEKISSIDTKKPKNAIAFKTRHLLVLAFFSWLLYVRRSSALVTILHF